MNKMTKINRKIIHLLSEYIAIILYNDTEIEN